MKKPCILGILNAHFEYSDLPARSSSSSSSNTDITKGKSKCIENVIAYASPNFTLGYTYMKKKNNKKKKKKTKKTCD